MFAYVYVKSLKDYKLVKSSEIEDFEYVIYGHQPRDFKTKVFEVTELDGTKYFCQILIVAETEGEIEEYIEENRPKVPRLNDSDFPKEKPINRKAIVTQEKQEAKKARKDKDSNKKHSKALMSKQIVSQYQKTLEADSDESSYAAPEHPLQNEEDSDTYDEDQDNDEDDESDDNYFEALPKNTMSSTDKTKSFNNKVINKSSRPKSNLSQNYSKDKSPVTLRPNETNSHVLPNNFDYEEYNENHVPNHMPQNTNLPNLRNNQQKNKNAMPSEPTTKEPLKRRSDTDLELALQDERKRRIRAEHAVKKLYDQGNMLKQKVAELKNNQEADNAEKRVFQLKRKALPTIINTQSRVFAKRSAVEDAYKKKEASHFCTNMFYAVWGYDTLAERCVARSKKTGTLRELTPHKKLVVETHFENFLNYYHDNPSLISYYMGKVNDYANRAIVGSRKKLKASKEYPVLDMEGIEEIEDRIQL